MLGEFGSQIDQWTLVPAKDGEFEIELGGELVFSKKATGQHADLKDMRRAFRERLGD